MFKALALKELRETVWIVVAAAAAYVYFTGGVFLSGVAVVPSASFALRGLSFVELAQANLGAFVMVSLALAVGLGLRQSASESSRGMWQFLLHRPADRRWILGAKLVVGMALYMAVAAAPILLLGLWGSIPGTHPSPFRWSMMSNHWLAWHLLTPLYLSGLLSGLRPGRWSGTRLLPVVGAGVIVLGIYVLFGQLLGWVLAFHLPGLVLTLAAVAILDLVLVIVVFFVAETRDFS